MRMCPAGDTTVPLIVPEPGSIDFCCKRPRLLTRISELSIKRH
jgi:hypothetical protein